MLFTLITPADNDCKNYINNKYALSECALHETLEIRTISLNVALSYVFKQSLTRWRFNHRESVPQSSYDQKPAAAHKQTP